MTSELDRSQWSSNEENKETVTNTSPFTSDISCVKSFTLAIYISENLLAADLKWSLFCAACNSYRFDSVLKPFPPFFLLHDNDKQIERLREEISLCPSMPNVVKQLKDDTLRSTLKDLLHWVLIHLKEPSFKFVSKTEHHNILSQASSEIPAAMPDYIFSVTYGNRHQQKFAYNASNYTTKYAFHGSRLDNFYSIVNYGLQVSFNKMAAFGPGIYLSNEMIVSLPFSSRGFTWESSILGSHISIVALCEVVCHPQVRSENASKKSNLFELSHQQQTPGKYVIVENSDLIRVQYLLVYNNVDFESSSLVQSRTLFGWFKRHKMFTFVIGYVIFLLGVGSCNSSILFRYYRKLLRRFDSGEKNDW